MRRRQFVRLLELTEFMVEEDIFRTLEIVIQKIEVSFQQKSLSEAKLKAWSEASRQKQTYFYFCLRKGF